MMVRLETTKTGLWDVEAENLDVVLTQLVVDRRDLSHRVSSAERPPPRTCPGRGRRPRHSSVTGTLRGRACRPGRLLPVGAGPPVMRQPASLPSCHRPGPGPLAARPDHSPTFLVAGVQGCEDTQQPVTPEGEEPMPDTLSSTLTTIALSWGVPLLLVFWYACRVRHPRANPCPRISHGVGRCRRRPAGYPGRGFTTTLSTTRAPRSWSCPLSWRCPSCFASSYAGGLAARPPCGARQSCRGRPRPSRPRHGMPSRPMPPNRPTSAASPPGQRTAPAPNRQPCRRGPGVSPGGLERSINVSS